MSLSNTSQPVSSRPDESELAEVIAMLGPLQHREDLPIDAKIKVRSTLFDALSWRARNIAAVPDLNDAIEAGESLLRILPSSHRDLSMYMDNIGFIKASRFQISKIQADIDDAIDLGQRALALISVGNPDWLNVANNLAYSLSARYKAMKELTDLDEAIRYTRQILQRATPHTPGYLDYLLNLGIRLHLRCEGTGDMANSDEALAVTRQLLEASTPGSREHAGALLNLAAFAKGRYDKTGFWKDLEESIRLQKLGIDGLSPSHEFRPQWNSNLAALYCTKYARTKEISDIQEAIRYEREAVMALPISNSIHSARGQHLTNYLQMLTQLARATTEISDVEHAISDAADLINPMPEVYAELVLNLRSYGELLSRKYELSSHPMDLYLLMDSAISFASQFNRFTRLKGESTSFDTNALLRLNLHAMKLAAEPQDHSVVLQMIRAMHQEYLKLVQTKSFIDALITLEKDVVINVEIVIIATHDRPWEDLEKEMKEQVEYATSLGAKSYQYRIKMVDRIVVPGPEDDSTDPVQELSKSLAGYHLGRADGSLTEERYFLLPNL
jgi:hypothetical protein